MTNEQPNDGTLQWSAIEFEHERKSSAWYGALGIGTATLAIGTFLLTRDWVAPIAIALAVIAFAVFSGREPSEQHYSLSVEGVQVGNQFISFENTTAFSVATDGEREAVKIERTKRFAEPVTLHFPPEIGGQIVDFLSQFMPYTQPNVTLVDTVIDRFKL